MPIKIVLVIPGSNLHCTKWQFVCAKCVGVIHSVYYIHGFRVLDPVQGHQTQPVQDALPQETQHEPWRTGIIMQGCSDIITHYLNKSNCTLSSVYIHMNELCGVCLVYLNGMYIYVAHFLHPHPHIRHCYQGSGTQCRVNGIFCTTMYLPSPHMYMGVYECTSTPHTRHLNRADQR